MARSVFVSYCHRQGEWVWERLIPVLRAAGCDRLYVDKERFTAGKGVKGQMDTFQDRAEVSLLVLSPEYIASEHCRHEMNRAIDGDAAFSRGTTLPVMLHACDMSPFQSPGDRPLWVDFTVDRLSDSWALLLRTLKADRLRTQAEHWLDVRDRIVENLLVQRQSVNLVVHGEPNWRSLMDHLRRDRIPNLGIVDLDDHATARLEGLVRQILAACGRHAPPRRCDLTALNDLKAHADASYLALCHFHNVTIRERKKAYGIELFLTLRQLHEDRKLVLLLQSRMPFRDLVPLDHPWSKLHPDTVELLGDGA